MDLLHAAESGRLSIVKELVSSDKSLIRTCRHKDRHNHAFNPKSYAIHYACRSGHLNVVKYLLEQDSGIIHDVDIEDWTPLHYACYNGHLNIVKLLLEYHANVNLRDNFLLQTPIEFAMYRQFEEIVKFLDPDISWTRRSADEIAKKGNVSAFREKSNLFLGRYLINDEHRYEIETFRKDPQAKAIELTNIQDVELNNRNVRIILTHDFAEHSKKTLELTSQDDQDDPFLRSSTTSTNEHILVF